MVATIAPRRSARLAKHIKECPPALNSLKVRKMSVKATKLSKKIAAQSAQGNVKPTVATGTTTPRMSESLSRNSEAKYKAKYRYVCGIDEAGRG